VYGGDGRTRVAGKRPGYENKKPERRCEMFVNKMVLEEKSPAKAVGEFMRINPGLGLADAWKMYMWRDLAKFPRVAK
jgi:hypothetical protein